MKRWIPAVVALAITATIAFAQQAVLITGKTGQTAASSPKTVLVDSLGRLVTSGSTGATCNVTTYGTTSVGVAATTVITADGGAGYSRLNVHLCNSPQNVGNPQVKCQGGTGPSPVMAIGNAGEVLGVGDCVEVALGLNVLSCISDTAATWVTTTDCLQ